MSNIIDFSEYLSSKNNIVKKALDTQLMHEAVAGLELELELRRAGVRNARVYHEDNHYAVVLELGIWTYFRFKMLIRLFHRETLPELFHRILKQRNAETKDVVVFRKWPSAKATAKLLKKWDIEPGENHILGRD